MLCFVALFSQIVSPVAYDVDKDDQKKYESDFAVYSADGGMGLRSSPVCHDDYGRKDNERPEYRHPPDDASASANQPFAPCAPFYVQIYVDYYHDHECGAYGNVAPCPGC